MTQMSFTICTTNFNPSSGEGKVFNFQHGIFRNRLKITRPPAAGIKLCIRAEKRSLTTDTMIKTLLFFAVIFTGEGVFCTPFHTDPKLLRCKFRLPIGTAFGIVGIYFWKIIHLNNVHEFSVDARGENPSKFIIMALRQPSRGNRKECQCSELYFLLSMSPN